MEMFAVGYRLEQSLKLYGSMPAKDRGWKDGVGHTRFVVWELITDLWHLGPTSFG